MNGAAPAKNVLFVTWDGPQTDYLQALFNPIFVRLREHGYRFHTLQFTWADRERVQRIRDACQQDGIGYRSHGIVRSPVSLGALATAMWGRFAVRSEIRRLNIDVVMPRTTLPALAAMLACGSRRDAPAFLLDADGLPYDERVEFGGWNASGVAYRLLRDLEAQSVRRADKVMVRSRFAAEVLAARAGPGVPARKFRVVGNGRDPRLFRTLPASERAVVRERLGIPVDAPLVAYAGSIGEQYYPKEMARFFEALSEHREDARFLVLTGNVEAATELFKPGLRPSLEGRISVFRASPAEVPELLGASDLALSFRVPGYSMKAVFPVKTGEYLLSGLPLVTNRGIGDLDETLGSSEAVRILDEVSPDAIKAAARWASEHALPDRERLGDKARNLGVDAFSIERTVDEYLKSLRDAEAFREARA